MIRDKIVSGSYSSASEVVREALRPLEKDKIGDAACCLFALVVSMNKVPYSLECLRNLTRVASWPCAAASARMASCLN